MKRRTLSALCLTIVGVLALSTLHAGCAARKEIAGREPPELGVRIPAIGKSNINVESQAESPVMRHGLPLSEADEARARWLTIFEIDVTPHGEPQETPGALPGVP